MEFLLYCANYRVSVLLYIKVSVVMGASSLCFLFHSSSMLVNFIVWDFAHSIQNSQKSFLRSKVHLLDVPIQNKLLNLGFLQVFSHLYFGGREVRTKLWPAKIRKPKCK